MQRDNCDTPIGLIELGSVSHDTQGEGGFYWEGFITQPHPGISPD